MALTTAATNARKEAEERAAKGEDIDVEAYVSAAIDKQIEINKQNKGF